ncbi:MAG: cytochrome B [Myxococcales bacterium]|jgi:membrane protein YqaA with SNARE-associated domain|nr:cytochrome B [Myxococcales bacterium]
MSLERETTEPGREVGRASPLVRRNLLRGLYDWVLHWAKTPYAVPALFLVSAAESSFFPVPPDPLLLALCLGASRKSLRFAAICTLASVLGGILGYAIGAGAWNVTQDWFFMYVPGVTPEAFQEVRQFYDDNGFAAIFLAGLTPIPYKVFTLASGVFSINFSVFVLASFLSRGLRFFLVAALVYRFGPTIERFVNLHFNKLVICFGALFVVGFLAIEFLL